MQIFNFRDGHVITSAPFRAVVKVRGLGGSALPLLPFEPPCNEPPPDWIYKVLFYA